MNSNSFFVRTGGMLIAFALVLSLISFGVVAQERPGPIPDEEGDDGGDDDEGGPIININLDAVIDVINDLIGEFTDFAENIGKKIAGAITKAIFYPFKLLAESLLKSFSAVLTVTPTVFPNPAVEEVHQDTLLVTYLISSLVFMVAGILHMVGPIFGFSYRQIRMIIPRTLLAVVFASVSLPLLQLAVEFTNALSTAFAPSNIDISVQQLAGLSAGLVLVWLIQAILLLALIGLFILRDIYILFGAAISPILALMWSLPKTKKYADAFIGGWYAALIIAPADLLVLKLALALMQGSGNTGLQSVSNWMFGVATFALLLIVPWQIWNTSGTAVSAANRGIATAKHRVRKYRRNQGGDHDFSELEEQGYGRSRSRGHSQRYDRHRRRR